MLKNYFKIDENETVSSFLKNLDDKKKMHYVILNDGSKYFVDIRSIALNIQRSDEKLKNLKKKLSISKKNTEKDNFKVLLESGDRVISKENGEYYDFLDGLNFILNENYNFLNNKIETNFKKEIFALNEDDKISQAKSLFINKKINLLPIISNKKIIGELRPMDLLVNELFSSKNERNNFINKKEDESVFNLHVSNISNKKPLLLNYDITYKEAILIMIKKKMASLIVVKNEELYSILSYKDLFKFASENLNSKKYVIEYNNSEMLFEDEFALIKNSAEKIMKKISNKSNYNLLKISFKKLGNDLGGHIKKIKVSFILSYGNHVLHIDNEFISEYDGEKIKNKTKKKWNVPLLVLESLKKLEEKVNKEKDKKIKN